MRGYSKPQKNYVLAKAHLQVLEDQSSDIDRKYIAEHNIVNPDGSIPEVTWAIEDDAIAENAMDECSKLVEESGLWAEILKARKLLRGAEDTLIAYGLALLPTKEREVLQKAVKEDYTIRTKVIDLTIKLDARTIKRPTA